jgi:hypothetical protein
VPGVAILCGRGPPTGGDGGLRPGGAGALVPRPRTPRARSLARSYLDLCTPICIMTWGKAVQEWVAFWLHELPGQEMIYHHVSLTVIFWLHLRIVQRRLRRSDPIFGPHADVTWD